MRNPKRRQSITPLPIYQRGIFSTSRFRKSIFFKVLQLKKRKQFFKEQHSKNINNKNAGISKIKSFFKQKRKKKNTYTLNRYIKKGAAKFLDIKKQKQKENPFFNKNANNSLNIKGRAVSTVNSKRSRFDIKFSRNNYRKYGKIRYKQKRVRFFRRKLKRFFRRRRYRTRRRRSFPRLKSVHRYFPTYVQNELRTLRSRKIRHPRTKNIFTGFRLSPAKMFAFYKTRGFLFFCLTFN